MSDQASEANKFAREKFGADVDAAAGASGFKVIGPSDPGQPPDVPWVELPGDGNRVIANFAADLGNALVDKPLFRREDLAVTVDATSGEVKMMDPERFLTWLAEHVIVFEERAVKVGKNDYQEKKFQRDMPLTTAKAVLKSDVFLSRLRPIVRVHGVRMPTMREDGRCELLKEGYDEESRIFTLTSPVKIDEAMDLVRAKAVFQSVLGEFPIEDARSMSVAIALPLSLFGVGLQALEAARLGFVFIANTRRAGKSLVAQIGISAVHGWPKATPRMKDEAEFNKVLAALVLQGQPYIFLDNLKGHFENGNLEAFLTSPEVQVRVMGTHRFMTGKVCCVPILTGNNLTLSDDLQWRVLQCNLYEPEFNPLARRHTRDLNPVAVNKKEMRSDILSALWALIRNWNEAQRPPAGTPEKPFQIPGFAEWSNIFGGIMQAAGYANPLEQPKAEKAAATFTQHQAKLIDLCAFDVDEKKPVKEFKFEELIACCVEHDLLTWKFKWKEKTEGDNTKYELNSADSSTMGKIFTDEMASKEDKKQRLYNLPDGKRVSFSKDGEGRGKRYIIEFLGRVAK